jgi:hypothetical protein
MLENNLHIMKTNTDILIVSSKEAGVDKREKTKYGLLSHHQNAGH